MYGSLKDRLGAILALLGFIIICCIYVFMKSQNGKSVEKVFGPETFYTPEQIADENQRQLYAEYNLGRLNECKKTTLSTTAVRSLSGISGSNWSCFFIPKSVYSTTLQKTVPTGSDYKAALGLTDRCTDKNEIKIYGDLISTDSFGSAAYDFAQAIVDYSGTDTFTEVGADGKVKTPKPNVVYEIVAPFSFKFENVNNAGTNDNKHIVILSADGKYRITFNKVANWFCAGSDGKPSDYENSGNNASWLRHVHQTIIGNSSNAKVKGGSAGCIIGYGYDDTTVIIEEIGNGGWVQTSLSEAIK